MSHQTLASTWQLLREVDDQGMILRDIVGNFILKSCRSNYHLIETPQRFLDYCLELSLTFDAIRFLNKTSQDTSASQNDLVAAILHLLQHIAYELGGSKGIITQASYIHILNYTVSSAIWTLRFCASPISHDLRQSLARASQRVLLKTPVDDQRLWLFQSLVNLLKNLYESEVAYNTDEGEISWTILRDASDNERLAIVQEIVMSATDPNIAAVDRIMTALNLCQLYWDTDLLLLESFHRLRRVGDVAKFFSSMNDTAAIQLAFTVRFAIQEQLAVQDTNGLAWQDALKVEPQILFRPGLAMECAQNTCACPFDIRVQQRLSGEKASHRFKVSSKHIQLAYSKCPVADLSQAFFEQAYYNFQKRIPSRITAKSSGNCGHGPSNGSMLSNQDLQNGEMESKHHLDQASCKMEIFSVKQRSMSQPVTNRQVSPSRTAYSKCSSVATSNASSGEDPLSAESKISHFPAGTVLSVQHTNASIHSAGSAVTIANANIVHDQAVEHVTKGHSPPPLVHSFSAPAWTAATGSIDSLTTASSSKLNTSSSDSRTAVSRWSSEKIRVATPTDKPGSLSIPASTGVGRVEKVYPEVVSRLVTSMDSDRLSLLSEAESARTKSSAQQNNSGRKWSTFLKSSKRTAAQFVVPKARFSANGKFIFMWTRYGGGYYDISNPQGVLFHAMNVQDIVMISGGTLTYAIVARSHQGYTLGVYQIGEETSLLSVSLSRQPSDMDVSLNDRYIAIKYTHFARIYDLEKHAKIDHRLPNSEDDKLGPGGNMIAFSHDSESFMASTRLGPEKVLTYWSDCTDKSRAMVAQSSAPCGHMDDHGLTGLTVCGPKVRGIPIAFLSTFTEKGSPVAVAMSSKNAGSRPLRDAKNAVGTRIHNAAMYVDAVTGKAHLVIANQNNEVFWVSDLFGRDQEVQKIRTLKRPKSMKPELLISICSANEATIFWMDKSSRLGTIIKAGKEGGMIKVTDDLRLDIEPLSPV